MKKKFVVFALCAAMVLSMAACGGSGSSSAAPAADTTAAATEGAGETTAAAEEGGAEATEAGSEAAGGETAAATADKAELDKIASEGLETSIQCDPIEISLACSGTVDGTVGGDAIYGAIDKVSEWTGGNFKVNFYPGGQLGGDTELIAAVQGGSVDIMQGAPTSQVTMVPELSVLDIGGLFKDVDGANAAIQAFYDRFDEAYGKAGMRLADMYVTDFRLLSSNKEINSAADLQGLNLRVQENEYHMTFWKELGCNATPLAFGELYIALQQGMMDAQENPILSLYGPMLYEVQKYLYMTNHVPFVNTMVMNKAKYDGMSDTQKQAMDQFFQYIRAYTIAGTAADNERMLSEMEAKGLQVKDVPEDIPPLFEAAADKVIEQMKSNGTVDAAFIDEYVKVARGQ